MSETRHDNTVTREDLELFLDGALPTARSMEVSDVLRADPAVRERLSRVSHLDALARVALLTPAPARSAGRPWALLAGISTVACVLLGVLVFARGTPVPSRADPVALAPFAVLPAAKAEGLVVLSFPIPVHAEADPITQVANTTPDPRAGGQPDAGQIHGAFATRLDAALARGDATGAASLLDGATPDQRAAGYRRLAATLRSVTTAERVLRGLSATERLAACRELAAQPRWSSITCAELRGLRSDETIRPAVERLLEEFSRTPSLAPLADRVRQGDRSL